MTESAIDGLIAQAKVGDDDAWVAVIASLQDEIALSIACYATTRAMYDEAVRTTWITCRSTLAQCPSTGAHAWIRSTTLTSIRHLLERELQPGTNGLSQALASPALRAVLAAGNGSSEVQGDMLRQHFGSLSDGHRAVLERRYRDHLDLAALAQHFGIESHLAAGQLFAARAAADWSAASSAVTDGLFPVLVEDFISGSISADSRGVLVGCVEKDSDRGLQVARQLRLALLLGALLHPSSHADAVSLAQVGTRKRGDTAGPGTKTSRITTRRHTSALRRSAAEEDLSENPDVHDTSSRRRLLFAGALIGIMLLVSLVSLLVIWRKSPGSNPPAPVNGAAATPTPDLGGAPGGTPRNAIGRILRHHAAAFVVEDAARTPSEDERSLLSGEGLATSDDGELVAQYGEHTRLSLIGDTVVDQVVTGTDRDALQVHLAHGNLTVASNGRPVFVLTAVGRVEVTSGNCLVQATAAGVALGVHKGDAHLERADGSHSLAVSADQRATLGAHDGPVLVAGGSFLLGVNLGGDDVEIHGHHWLSHRSALLAGLTVQPGTAVAPSIAISAAGMDFDTKAMLSSGLVAPAGPLHLTQRAPAGEYDLSLWIASEDGMAATGLALRLQGHAVELGAPAERSDNWWRLGPYRVASQAGAIDLSIDGLSRMRLSGLQIDSVSGSAIPATVALTSPSPDQHLYSNQPVSLNVEVLGASDTLAKVQYFDGEMQVADSAKAPFAATCTVAAGEHRFSAKAVSNSGEINGSSPVTIRLLPAFGDGGISAEMYQGIGGEAVKDLTSNAAFPDHPSSRRVLGDFEQRKLGYNYGSRIRGWISAPLDGAYEFFISADDSAELWLSTDAQEAGKRRIALCPSHVLFRDWGKFADQHSQPVTLAAGQRYYIEALYKQGTADDWLSVGWKLPDGTLERPVPSVHLSPYTAAAGTPATAKAPATGAAAAPAPAAAEPPAPPAEPRFVKGIHLGGDTVVVDGNHWLSQQKAESDGLAVKNARKITVFLEPKPAVDAGMKAALTTGLAASNGPLTITQRLPSGKYLIYVWTLETVRSESRSFSLDINGSTLADIGSLPLDGWSRYGPCEVDVADGLLQVVAKPKKGNPQLMGLAIYTPPLSLVADGKGWAVNATAYHVSLSADGCVTGLSIGGTEFLHPMPTLPGGYFMQNGPQKLVFDAPTGDNQLVARNDRVNVRYAFRPNGATLQLSNTSDKPVDWFFLLDQRVSVASDGKTFCKMPVRQGWHDSLWFSGTAKLGFAGASQVWPFEQNTEAMQVTIPPMQSRELVLSISSASAEEQQAVSGATSH